MKPGSHHASHSEIIQHGPSTVPARAETTATEMQTSHDGAQAQGSSAPIQSQPVITSRGQAENPFKANPVTSAVTRPSAPDGYLSDKAGHSWTELMPLDVRFSMLQALAKQPSPEVVQRDLASYACTSNTAHHDVMYFHRMTRNHRGSLLASRNLMQKAWNTAVSKGWFGRMEAFRSSLEALVDNYSAIIIDGRMACADAKLATHAIPIILQSRVEYLHLCIGYPDIAHDGTWGLLERENALDCLKSLIVGCIHRLGEGRPLPAVFLQMEGLAPSEVGDILQNTPIRLNIAGVSLCSDNRHLTPDPFVHAKPESEFSLTEHLGLVRKPMMLHQQTESDWQSFLFSLGAIKYLHLSGWSGPGLLNVLMGLITKETRIEELHLPSCAMAPDLFRQFLISLPRTGSIKLLAIDNMYSGLSSASMNALSRLLDDQPEMRLVMGGAMPDAIRHRLEPYRRAGRVMFDRYPQAMRDLPEIYSSVDLFKPAM